MHVICDFQMQKVSVSGCRWTTALSWRCPCPLVSPRHMSDAGRSSRVSRFTKTSEKRLRPLWAGFLFPFLTLEAQGKKRLACSRSPSSALCQVEGLDLQPSVQRTVSPVTEDSALNLSLLTLWTHSDTCL